MTLIPDIRLVGNCAINCLYNPEDEGGIPNGDPDVNSQLAKPPALPHRNTLFPVLNCRVARRAMILFPTQSDEASLDCGGEGSRGVPANAAWFEVLDVVATIAPIRA
jgi:hypothetical protein